MIYDIKTKHHGEQALALVCLQVLSLIEKHYKPFDGQRGQIQDGSSAKFIKVTKAFQQDCEKLTDARIWVKNDAYSVSINIDIHTPNPDNVSCSYYKEYIYIGEYKSLENFQRSQDFSYSFDKSATTKRLNRILKTTVKDIETAKDKIKKLDDEIDKARSSIPHTFRDCLPN